MRFQFISHAFICALPSIFQIEAAVEWRLCSVLHQFLKLLLVLLILIINQIVIHAISQNLSSDPLLVVSQVLLRNSLHVVSNISFVHVMENAFVLLVSLGDLDLGNRLFGLFLHWLDGTVKMLDLRHGLGAACRIQEVVRISMKAKLVRHFNEVYYLIVING